MEPRNSLPPPEPSEDELLALDRGYNLLKNSGALAALEELSALQLDLQHGGAQ